MSGQGACPSDRPGLRSFVYEAKHGRGVPAAAEAGRWADRSIVESHGAARWPRPACEPGRP